MPPSLSPEERSLTDLIARVVQGADLAAAEAEFAFGEIMAGRATPAQVAALLVALRAKGEHPAELAGGVRALRHAMVRVPVRTRGGRPLVDTCGTGGGRFGTFNISTAAAILAAGMGVSVAKHGNRSYTSRCGSADVLEALGIRIELDPPALGRVFDRAGMVFMFAPLLHPAMRHVAPVRRELGFPTIMNLLGPLTNPAGARRQLVGVSDPRLLDLMAGALLELGHERALVVHGEPGMDELSPIGPSEIVELRDGALERYRLEPRHAFGWEGLDSRELAGGGPAENARRIEDVLAGRGGAAASAAVVLNAAAALYVAGLADSLEGAVPAAQRGLEEGKGLSALRALREAAGAAVPARGGP